MYSNCALRSGCEQPSFVLRFACRLYFCSCNSSATSMWLTSCPWAQFVGEIPHAFACPPQRGLRIPSRHWFQQFFQIEQQIRIFERRLLPTAALLPNRQMPPL